MAIGNFSGDKKEYGDQKAYKRSRYGNEELLHLVGRSSAEPGNSSHAVQGRFQGFYREASRGEEMSQFVEKDANELEEHE